MAKKISLAVALIAFNSPVVTYADSNASVKPDVCTDGGKINTSIASNSVGTLSGVKVNGSINITTTLSGGQIAVATRDGGDNTVAIGRFNNNRYQIALAAGKNALAINSDNHSVASAGDCAETVKPQPRR